VEQRLKQRLVGAGVLVALAVLLLPLWLDGEGIKSLSVEEIPPEPTIIEPTTPRNYRLLAVPSWHCWIIRRHRLWLRPRTMRRLSLS